MRPYELLLSEAAAMAFALASSSDQSKLALFFEQLKAAPFRSGDLQERDALGRENQIAVVDDWIVTYWPDHFAKEMRLLRLEPVES